MKRSTSDICDRECAQVVWAVYQGKGDPYDDSTTEYKIDELSSYDVKRTYWDQGLILRAPSSPAPSAVPTRHHEQQAQGS
jgi:hypothetical protein